MQVISLPVLARTFGAWQNCIKKGNKEWESNHEDRIEELLKLLPSGSGLDAGVKLDWENSTIDRLVFTFGFHHMNEAGYYDGWTEHKLKVTASLSFGFELHITGRNRNMIKDYLYDLFREVFTMQEIIYEHKPITDEKN